MYTKLLKFLKKNKIFFDKQFGFKEKHSTDHAILSIIDKIKRAIVCGIFLDFIKASDTIDHSIFINKLEHY